MSGLWPVPACPGAHRGQCLPILGYTMTHHLPVSGHTTAPCPPVLGYTVTHHLPVLVHTVTHCLPVPGHTMAGARLSQGTL